MSRYGMLIDVDKCLGCHACTVTCQQRWDLKPDVTFTKVREVEFGQFPDAQVAFIPTQCMHCDEPPCVEVCPSGASYKTDAGPVLIDESQCVGCRYCISACPYDARTYNEEQKIVQKCQFCFDRLEKGEKPACVVTCIGGARVFGDLDDPKSEISKAIRERNALPIKGTSFQYALPKNVDRKLIPQDFKAPEYVTWWKNVIQPGGKLLMGGAVGAIAISALRHLVSSGHGKPDSDKKEGETDGDRQS